MSLTLDLANLLPSVLSALAVALILGQYKWQRKVDIDLTRIKTLLKIKDS